MAMYVSSTSIHKSLIHLKFYWYLSQREIHSCKDSVSAKNKPQVIESLGGFLVKLMLISSAVTVALRIAVFQVEAGWIADVLIGERMANKDDISTSFHD